MTQEVMGGSEPTTLCLVADVICELELDFCDTFMAVKCADWEGSGGWHHSRCGRGLLVLVGNLVDRGRVVVGLDGSRWIM